MFIVHGNLNSPSTSLVLLCAAEMGLGPDKVKLAVLSWSELYEPAHLADQPFGMQPWGEDTETGVKMFECRAMARYLAGKYKHPLCPPPTDMKAFAAFEQAASIEISNFALYASELCWQIEWNPKHMNIPTDHNLVKWMQKTFSKRLEGYERILSSTKYLAGDKMTLADLFHVPLVHAVLDIGALPGLKESKFPVVKKWAEGLTGLKSWQDILLQEAEYNKQRGAATAEAQAKA